MNTLSIVVLIIAGVLPLVGMGLSVWLAYAPKHKLIARLAVALPLSTLIAGELLIDRSAVIAGHPEWNLDIPSQPMGPLAVFGLFYALALMVPVMVITFAAVSMVGSGNKVPSLEH